MKALPREFVLLVERILREYPEREAELDRLERWISGICHAICLEPPTTRNLPTGSPQQRILEMKESDCHYQWLTRHVALIREALGMLNLHEGDLVSCLYWKEMDYEEVAMEMKIGRATVFRMKRRIIDKVGPILLPDAKMILEVSPL